MKRMIIACTALMVSVITIAAPERPYFDKKKDLLLAQFDSKPDPDDIHSQAALGSMMCHKDLRGVKVFAVSGAIGEQGGTFIDSEELFDAAFGKHWTAANDDWDDAVEDIVERVYHVLKRGGKVWVPEAGQSDITADWLREILEEFPAELVKNNVVVVQHSNWNEEQTNDADLAYVKKMTNYFSIDDGNAPMNDNADDRGVYATPEYRDRDAKWLADAKTSKKRKARKLWTLADQIIDSYYPEGFKEEWSYLTTDGVDYSDCCEVWWILNIGERADTHAKFWARYVVK